MPRLKASVKTFAGVERFQKGWLPLLQSAKKTLRQSSDLSRDRMCREGDIDKNRGDKKNQNRSTGTHMVRISNLRRQALFVHVFVLHLFVTEIPPGFLFITIPLMAPCEKSRGFGGWPPSCRQPNVRLLLCALPSCAIRATRFHN